MAFESRNSPNRGPDYDGLVALLPYMRQQVNHLGETVVTRPEAKKIRDLGFNARAGCKWCCPLLPNLLVRDNPMLKHLSVEMDEFWRPRDWNPQRARPIDRYAPSPIGAIGEKILRLVRMAPGQRLAKRSVQQRLWRLPATILNHVLCALSSAGYVQWRNGWLSTSGTSPGF
jgi:hypothetical protein